MEHNEAKTNQSEQEERRIKKNEEIFPATLGQLQAFKQFHHRGARRRRENKIGNLFEKIMKKNFSNLVKEIDIHTCPESPESPKQDGCKEAHSKTHHN